MTRVGQAWSAVLRRAERRLPSLTRLRSPEALPIVLHRRRIYIVPTGFGLGFTGPEKGFFLYTDPAKTHLSASADVSGNALDFEARIGPL